MESGDITDLRARQVLDSRGFPTIEVECSLSDGARGRAIVPSGASTGQHEALELRDGDESLFSGKGVLGAVANVNAQIRDALIGMQVADQQQVDQVLLELDGTPNKSSLGANAMLGASLACLHAAAAHAEQPLWRHIAGDDQTSIPVPQMNILNGGAHAASNVDVQEFMVVPHGFDDYPTALRAGVECYHALKSELKRDGLLGGLGDEGGFAPNLPSNEDGLRYVLRAIEAAGYSSDQVGIALDVAATEFQRGEHYRFEGNDLSAERLGEIYSGWLDEYPIISLEDAFGEDDWAAWAQFTKREGERVQVVGDDIYVTQRTRLERGISEGTSNSILIKLNQIGTVSETLDTMATARAAGFSTVISHRSGETEDVTIADFAVGTNAGQIKTGAPARSDRVAKYNQLLRISEECDGYASPF